MGLTLLVAMITMSTHALSQSVTVTDLARQTHIHGLAVDHLAGNQLLIATHHGLFRAGPDGKAERISVVQDFMGFTPHPSSPGTLYASGHPAEGGNLGLIASHDNGVTWRRISPGAGGPVDFHQMTVSSADPQVIYGAYGALQVSRDAGRTWAVAGPLPDGLIDLAASAEDADTLYAGTETGLLRSIDAGRTWSVAIPDAPVSTVEVGSDGVLYGFVVGRGLVRSGDGQSGFEPVGTAWGDRILLHLAVDPGDSQRIFATTQDGQILASSDGGANWRLFGS